MIHKTLRHFIFWSCSALFLLISGCASTPDYNDVQVRFEAGKEAFLAHEYAKAAHLFEPLAVKGHGQAQYTLGYLYYYGLGITQNSEVGKKWISSSAAKGNQLAHKALELISKEEAKVKKEEVDKVKETESDTPITIVEPPIEVTAAQLPNTPSKPTPTAPLAESKSDETKATDWIFDQPPGSYTIQLTSLSNKAAAQGFLVSNPLDGVTKLISYYSQGSRRYGIIYGSFPTYIEAKEALAKLPHSLANASPWIRNFSHFKELLQQP
jgi:hypothetical protein